MESNISFRVEIEVVEFIKQVIMTPFEAVAQLKKQMSKSIIGQDELIEKILLVLLADGNVLLESLPGLAKTRTIKSLAKNLECGLSRNSIYT